MISIKSLLKSSDKGASLLPKLLSNSSLLLQSILVGLHSTRFAGKGENFWQFKEYTQGESINNVDWRKSASSKRILIKQNEKELAKTIYFFFDKSLSMNFKSSSADYNKLFFSALFTLTLTRLFSKSKEEIFIFNNRNKPINFSNNFDKFNKSFLENNINFSLPDPSLFKDKSFCIFFSDFFFDKTGLVEIIKNFKNRRILGLLIQILDPKEASFKINRNTRLKDMETNETITLDPDENFSNTYKKKLSELQFDLNKICYNSGWKFSKFYTNQDINAFIINIAKTIIFNKQKLV